MSKNTKGIIWATVAIAMLIISAVTYVRTHTKPKVKAIVSTGQTTETKQNLSTTTPTELPNKQTATTTPVVATSTPTTTPITAPKVYKKKTPPPAASLSYGDAVAKYPNRIQFNSLCQSSTGQLALANNSVVMFDNRSENPITITITDKAYMVAGYNYVVVTLSQKLVPLRLHIGCNNNPNAVEILLQ